jgi:Domain of unknown function (DUF4232)
VIRAVVALAVAAMLAGCGGSTTVTVTQTVTTTRTVTGTATTPSTSAAACAGNDLTGTFAVVPGSAGAGHISYELTLTNASKATCYVSGIPPMQLLDASGNPLPTHAAAANPGQALAARIVLAPGDSAYAQARFSPDVPGVGEQQTGACEPKASKMRVSPNGPSSLDVPVTPPTLVCEQGALSFELLSSSP